MLVALPTEAKKAAYRQRAVGKDITEVTTIIVKSLPVLDKITNEEQNQLIFHEVAMLNGTLVLLGMLALS